MDVDVASEALGRVAARHPGLRVLLLHGSRARGDAHARSDWDVGYLADDVDPLDLTAEIVAALGTDDVDVVDLAHASALLRFAGGRDGRLATSAHPATASPSCSRRRTSGATRSP